MQPPVARPAQRDDITVELVAEARVAAVVQVTVAEVPRAAADLADRLSPVRGGPAVPTRAGQGGAHAWAPASHASRAACSAGASGRAVQGRRSMIIGAAERNSNRAVPNRKRRSSEASSTGRYRTDEDTERPGEEP